MLMLWRLELERNFNARRELGPLTYSRFRCLRLRQAED